MTEEWLSRLALLKYEVKCSEERTTMLEGRIAEHEKDCDHSHPSGRPAHEKTGTFTVGCTICGRKEL